MSTQQQPEGAKLNLSVTSRIKSKILCCNYRVEQHITADSPKNRITAQSEGQTVGIEPDKDIVAEFHSMETIVEE